MAKMAHNDPIWRKWPKMTKMDENGLNWPEMAKKWLNMAQNEENSPK